VPDYFVLKLLGTEITEELLVNLSKYLGDHFLTSFSNHWVRR